MKPYFISLWLLLSFFLNISCQQSQKKSSPESQEQVPPKLLRPDVKKIWIPAIIKNGGAEWEEGHYLYRIERDTTWSR